MARTRANSSRGNRPLSGRRVVITRARSQAGAFAQALESVGAEVVEFPTIEILPPASYDPLDRALRRLRDYDWVIFTSVNGVGRFFARCKELGGGVRDLGGIKVAAIGPETAKRLESMGLRPDLVPREFRAEAILQELAPEEMRGKRVLLPRAAQARDVLPKTLQEWGAEVEVVEAYRTVAPKGDAGRLGELLRRRQIDMITFTSSSTVANFAALLNGADIQRLLSDVAVACIGPITEKTARGLGIRVDLVSKDYTIPGLTKAIVEYFNRSGR